MSLFKKGKKKPEKMYRVKVNLIGTNLTYQECEVSEHSLNDIRHRIRNYGVQILVNEEPREKLIFFPPHRVKTVEIELEE